MRETLNGRRAVIPDILKIQNAAIVEEDPET
jgi:hypothetical protein